VDRVIAVLGAEVGVVEVAPAGLSAPFVRMRWRKLRLPTLRSRSSELRAGTRSRKVGGAAEAEITAVGVVEAARLGA
jgi:hypothetical protein